MFQEEKCEKDRCERSYEANENAIEIQGKNTVCELFKCDKVFNEESTQTEIFQPLKPLVEDAIKGKKCTVFALGQTGAGKTHTFQGRDGKDGIV